MCKKIILFSLFAVFFCDLNLARAEVVINEIMYAPVGGSNYEWVEVYNSGSDSVDLSGWRFFHSESTSGPLTLRNGDSAILQSGGYAVIAKNPSVVTSYDWLNFSGMIFSASTLSLPDSGDNTYIAVASDANKTISNSVTYDTSLGGSKESGNSLSKINGSWKGGTPTPGTANQSSSASVPSNDDVENDNSMNDDGSESENDPSSTSTTSSSRSSGKTTSKTKVAASKMRAEILTRPLGYVGIPHVFRGTGFGSDNKTFSHGRYFWNFGDGDFREVKVMNTDKFTHTYLYAGDYTVLFEHYPDDFSDIPDTSETAVVKVVAPSISISSVGNDSDFFIELSNDTNYDIDVSSWFIKSDRHSFMISKGTIIKSKKKLMLSPFLTHFSAFDKNTLKLVAVDGNLVFDYSASLVAATSSLAGATNFKPKTSVNKANEVVLSKKGDLENENEINLSVSEQIKGEDLEASVISSDIQKKDSGIPYMPAIASFIFIGVSASAVYFIRRNNAVSK